jgi:hypothetical protein
MTSPSLWIASLIGSKLRTAAKGESMRRCAGHRVYRSLLEIPACHTRFIERSRTLMLVNDVFVEDKAENESSLKYGFRLMSSYQITETKKLWVISEGDRSVTTLLLPAEYGRALGEA